MNDEKEKPGSNTREEIMMRGMARFCLQMATRLEDLFVPHLQKRVIIATVRYPGMVAMYTELFQQSRPSTEMIPKEKYERISELIGPLAESFALIHRAEMESASDQKSPLASGVKSLSATANNAKSPSQTPSVAKSPSPPNQITPSPNEVVLNIPNTKQECSLREASPSLMVMSTIGTKQTCTLDHISALIQLLLCVDSIHWHGPAVEALWRLILNSSKKELGPIIGILSECIAAIVPSGTASLTTPSSSEKSAPWILRMNIIDRVLFEIERVGDYTRLRRTQQRLLEAGIGNQLGSSLTGHGQKFSYKVLMPVVRVSVLASFHFSVLRERLIFDRNVQKMSTMAIDACREPRKDIHPSDMQRFVGMMMVMSDFWNWKSNSSETSKARDINATLHNIWSQMDPEIFLLYVMPCWGPGISEQTTAAVVKKLENCCMDTVRALVSPNKTTSTGTSAETELLKKKLSYILDWMVALAWHAPEQVAANSYQSLYTSYFMGLIFRRMMPFIIVKVIPQRKQALLLSDDEDDLALEKSLAKRHQASVRDLEAASDLAVPSVKLRVPIQAAALDTKQHMHDQFGPSDSHRQPNSQGGSDVGMGLENPEMKFVPLTTQLDTIQFPNSSSSNTLQPWSTSSAVHDSMETIGMLDSETDSITEFSIMASSPINSTASISGQLQNVSLASIISSSNSNAMELDVPIPKLEASVQYSSKMTETERGLRKKALSLLGVEIKDEEPIHLLSWLSHTPVLKASVIDLVKFLDPTNPESLPWSLRILKLPLTSRALLGFVRAHKDSTVMAHYVPRPDRHGAPSTDDLVYLEIPESRKHDLEYHGGVSEQIQVDPPQNRDPITSPPKEAKYNSLRSLLRGEVQANELKNASSAATSSPSTSSRVAASQDVAAIKADLPKVSPTYKDFEPVTLVARHRLCHTKQLADRPTEPGTTGMFEVHVVDSGDTNQLTVGLTWDLALESLRAKNGLGSLKPGRSATSLGLVLSTGCVYYMGPNNMKIKLPYVFPSGTGARVRIGIAYRFVYFVVDGIFYPPLPDPERTDGGYFMLPENADIHGLVRLGCGGIKLTTRSLTNRWSLEKYDNGTLRDAKSNPLAYMLYLAELRTKVCPHYHAQRRDLIVPCRPKLPDLPLNGDLFRQLSPEHQELVERIHISSSTCAVDACTCPSYVQSIIKQTIADSLAKQSAGPASETNSQQSPQNAASQKT
jgi:hypothetical protein